MERKTTRFDIGYDGWPWTRGFHLPNNDRTVRLPVPLAKIIARWKSVHDDADALLAVQIADWIRGNYALIMTFNPKYKKPAIEDLRLIMLRWYLQYVVRPTDIQKTPA